MAGEISASLGPKWRIDEVTPDKGSILSPHIIVRSPASNNLSRSSSNIFFSFGKQSDAALFSGSSRGGNFSKRLWKGEPRMQSWNE